MSQYNFHRLLGDMLLQFPNNLNPIQQHIGRAKVLSLFEGSWGEILGQPNNYQGKRKVLRNCWNIFFSNINNLLGKGTGGDAVSSQLMFSFVPASPVCNISIQSRNDDFDAKTRKGEEKKRRKTQGKMNAGVAVSHIPQ